MMNNPLVITIAKEIGSDLSSRSRATALRSRLLEDVKAGSNVILDFEGVRTVSDSFADELFGVTVAALGEDWFRTHLEIKNLAGNLRPAILGAISDRLAAQSH